MKSVMSRRAGRLSAALVAALICVSITSFLLGMLAGGQAWQGTPAVSTSSVNALVNSTAGKANESLSNPALVNASPRSSNPLVMRFSSYLDILKLRNESQHWIGPESMQPSGLIPLTSNALRNAVATPTYKSTTTTTAAEVEYSRTNVQVRGVDEADIVKNDGKYLYIVGRTVWVRTGSSGLASPETPVYIVRAYPPSELRVVSKLMIKGVVDGLYVWRDKLVIINRSIGYLPLIVVRMPPYGGLRVPPLTIISGYVSETNVLIYNVKVRSQPKLVNRVEVSGNYLTSRLINGSLYLMTTYPVLTFWARNSVLIPEVNGKPLKPSSIGYVNVSPVTEPWILNYVTIVGINLGNASFKAEAYVVPYPRWVFVSRDSIYLISNSFNYYPIMLEIVRHALIPTLPKNVSVKILHILSSNSTIWRKLSLINKELSNYVRRSGIKGAIKVVGSIYGYVERKVLWRPLTSSIIIKFRLKGLRAVPVAEAVIPGHILSQFAMWERKGYFIVATTSTVIKEVRILGTGGWLGIPVITPSITTINSIYVLNSSNLRVTASLNNLAKGERIYAARFVGNYLFLVTYRSIDPLFAINLTNPARPEVIGYVNSTGFSRYLHPYGSHYLIGVGLETNKHGIPLGVKVTLYDVGNPRRIKVLSNIVIKASWSTTQVLWNHKAFLINPSKGYIAIPVTIYGRGFSGSYLYVIKVSNESLKILGRIKQAGVVRAAYIGNYLYAISRNEVTAASLPSLKVVKSLILKP